MPDFQSFYYVYDVQDNRCLFITYFTCVLHCNLDFSETGQGVKLVFCDSHYTNRTASGGV